MWCLTRATTNARWYRLFCSFHVIRRPSYAVEQPTSSFTYAATRAKAAGTTIIHAALHLQAHLRSRGCIFHISRSGSVTALEEKKRCAFTLLAGTGWTISWFLLSRTSMYCFEKLQAARTCFCRAMSPQHEAYREFIFSPFRFQLQQSLPTVSITWCMWPRLTRNDIETIVCSGRDLQGA